MRTILVCRLRALAGVAQSVGALSHRRKGCGFNPWSVHKPRFWVQSLGRVCTGRQPIDIYISLRSLSLSLSLSQQWKKCPLGRIKKKKLTLGCKLKSHQIHFLHSVTDCSSYVLYYSSRQKCMGLSLITEEHSERLLAGMCVAQIKTLGNTLCLLWQEALQSHTEECMVHTSLTLTNEEFEMIIQTKTSKASSNSTKQTQPLRRALQDKHGVRESAIHQTACLRARACFLLP